MVKIKDKTFYSKNDILPWNFRKNRYMTEH